jgi:hypothetical protein
MNHKGEDFTVVKTDVDGFWRWQFQIGDQIKPGRTETKIELLAIRRAQLRIDQALREIAPPHRRSDRPRPPTSGIGNFETCVDACEL